MSFACRRKIHQWYILIHANMTIVCCHIRQNTNPISAKQYITNNSGNCDALQLEAASFDAAPVVLPFKYKQDHNATAYK